MRTYRLVGNPAEDEEPKDMTEQDKPAIVGEQAPSVLRPRQPPEFSQYRLNRLEAHSSASIMIPSSTVTSPPHYSSFDQPIGNVPYHPRSADPQGFVHLQHSFPRSDPRWPEPSYPLSWFPGASPQTIQLPTPLRKGGRKSNKCAECKKQKKVREPIIVVQG
jgi:hypothetical protein